MLQRGRLRQGRIVPPRLLVSGSGVSAPGVSDVLAVGRARISVVNCGTGRAFIRAARMESRTKSCITLCCRKRTSVFEG
jgi:hypothetical protein